MRRLIAFASVLLLLLVAVPLVGSVATAGGPAHSRLSFEQAELFVENIFANRTTVYQGGAVMLTDNGVHGGAPAYTVYRWYEKMPNQTDYFVAAYASGTTGSAIETFLYTPEPSRDHPGLYDFILGVTDSQGSVANSTPVGITVLPEQFTTTIAPVRLVVNVTKGQANVTENFTIGEDSSTRVRFNGTNQSFLAYTDYPKKLFIRFLENPLPATSSSVQALPEYYVPLTALTYTTYANRSAPVNYTATLPYPCDSNRSALTPFYLVYDQWYRITNFTINQRSCALSFTSAPNATLVVTEYVPPITTSSTTSIFVPVTNTISHVVVTNASTTTIPATPVQRRGNGTLYIGIVVILIIIAGGVVLYRRVGKREKEEQNKSFRVPSEPVEPGRI